MASRDDSRLVYSTDRSIGRCLVCGQMKSACQCKSDRASKAPGEQTVKVRFEKKGRGGKAVTILDGLALSNADLADLLKELKGRCACGGTVDGSNLELQGDQRDRAIELLLKKGFKAKKAGG